MAKPANRAQKQALKKKKREQMLKKKKQTQAAQASQGESQDDSIGISDLPIADCTISDGWQERGLAHVLIARRLPNENLIAAGYYLDTLCLGLKDTGIIREVEESEFEENLKENIFNDPVDLVECDPSLALSIVEGAIAFAEEYGFKPNKRWAQTSKMLEGIEPSGEKLEFGRDGKPYFIDRGETNAKAIISRLERKAGEGNFFVEKEEE